MSTDERPDSLASQAASWVPPWERRRTPDPAYAAAAAPIDMTDPDEPEADEPDPDEPEADEPDPDEPEADEPEADEPEADEPEADGAGTDGAGPGDVPPELPPIPGEAEGPATVDAPQVLPGEPEPAPTDVGVAPDVPVPGALETAEDADPDHAERGAPVDAPAPIGDDAGEVVAPVGPDIADPDIADPDIADPDAADPGSVDPGVAKAPPSAGGSGDADPPAVAVRRRTSRKEPVADVLPAIDEAELRAALEAVLLVVDEPVGELQLAQIMEQPAERVAAVLEEISAAYTAAGHGFDLRRAAGGWRLYTRPEYAPYVERFVLDGQSVRLTQAALETLAVIAYKQPVTRSRISVIRGVNCDGVMRTLVTRGLIEECGVETETGAFLYRTTVLFLEKLGLDSVDQLPPLAPFLPDDVEEVLDAQR